MAVGLVGEVDDAQIGKFFDARSIVRAAHMELVAEEAIAQRDLARLFISKGIQRVLHQFLDQMLRRPCRIHGCEAFGADGQPALGLGLHGG